MIPPHEYYQNAYQNLFGQLGIDNVLDHYDIVSEQDDYSSEALLARLAQTNKKLLVALDSNPYSQDTYQDLSQLHPRIRVLSGNLLHLWQNSNITYFPHFFLTQLQEENFQHKTKNFRFGFLSRHPRRHRFYLYQKIKSFITADDCVAVHGLDQIDCDYHDPGQYHACDLFLDVPFATPNAQDPTFGINAQVPFWNAGDHTNRHNAYNSYFYITGESSDKDHIVFLSEKTWKSFRSQCLTITYGNPSTNRALKMLGFSQDHDIDAECVIKAEWISRAMKSWNSHQCRELYHSNLAAIDHNFNRFYSQDIRHLFAKHVKCQLEL